MLPISFIVVCLGQSWSPGPDGIPIPETGTLNQKGTPFTAPGRLFAVEVPNGWGVALHEEDPNTIEFRGVGRPGNATLQIRRMAVPRGAHPKQLMRNALETRLKKLPGFRQAAQRDVKVAGYKAAAVTGSYSYQGNIQFPLAVEEIFVVVGNDSFVFHFECFEPVAGDLAGDINRFYTTFQPRPASGEASPFSPQEPREAMPDPNKVPF
jgi:hypothetical protein